MISDCSFGTRLHKQHVKIKLLYVIDGRLESSKVLNRI